MNKRTRNYILVAIALVGVWYFFLKGDSAQYEEEEEVVLDNSRNPSTGVDNSTITTRLQTPIIR